MGMWATPAEVPRSEIPFRLLGPLELVDDNGRRCLLPGRQQAAMSALLIRANRVASIDQLVDAIWEETPPPTARAQVQFCMHTLRRALDDLRMPARIVTQPPGYRLDVHEDHLDSHCFERHVENARALTRARRAEEAVDAFRRGLGLWRGAALDGAGRALRDQVLWLDRMRGEALEQSIELELGLGQHREVVGRLRVLLAADPLAEGFRHHLMLALYRSGMKGEALDVYRDGCALMAEQLGLDPGEKLRRLQEAILADDPALFPAEESAPRPVAFLTHLFADRPLRQLPADLPDFTGRTDLAADLSGLLANDGNDGNDGDGDRAYGCGDAWPGGRAVPRIVNITGMAGVGKSAFAVHLAHRLSDAFPDGQLYVDLGGVPSPGPGAALAQILTGFGYDAAALPGVSASAALYRSLLADRKVLVLLDGAEDEKEVAPLLPGSASCTVLVTSRRRLTGLPGARFVPVEPFTEDEATSLLARMAGRARVEREPGEAAALADLTSGLPLALRIVGARLRARPHWPLATMVRSLEDEHRRLDALIHGELAVRDRLLSVHAGLDAEEARLLRRLGALGGRRLPRWTAAAVLDGGWQHADDLLERLAETGLLDTSAAEPGHFRWTDLVRVFATERLRGEEPEAEPAALRRALQGWQSLAERASRLPRGGGPAGPGTPGASEGDEAWRVPDEYAVGIVADPVQWLDAEQDTLHATLARARSLGLASQCATLIATLTPLTPYHPCPTA
ncbi:BTAD domain-containing putative transcriptional regulator [Streptomyces sp. NPDC091279]|uniref:AfsR/SARP family transcriptional regulator n=1 Tax=Streptomyces sp. NPDC091279 TaxID=3365983 RepID=UPI0038109B94